VLTELKGFYSLSLPFLLILDAALLLEWVPELQPTLTHGEVPAYNLAGVPWSKAECPTEGSGHGALRNGHAGATTSAAGIWVEGGTPPGTAMRLLGVCKPGQLP